jgi:hypothetical protein
MILTTHAITGATLATLVPSNPVLGFVIGFGSHFILDSIPHWDYSLQNSKKDKNKPLNNDLIINRDSLRDLMKIALDGISGLVLSFILLGIFRHQSILAISCGAIGGMAPDALQFVYFKWRHEPLISLQKFHIWMHSKYSLKKRPVLGMSSQLAIVTLIYILFQ